MRACMFARPRARGAGEGSQPVGVHLSNLVNNLRGHRIRSE